MKNPEYDGTSVKGRQTPFFFCPQQDIAGHCIITLHEWPPGSSYQKYLRKSGMWKVLENMSFAKSSLQGGIQASRADVQPVGSSMPTAVVKICSVSAWVGN